MRLPVKIYLALGLSLAGLTVSGCNATNSSDLSLTPVPTMITVNKPQSISLLTDPSESQVITVLIDNSVASRSSITTDSAPFLITSPSSSQDELAEMVTAGSPFRTVETVDVEAGTIENSLGEVRFRAASYEHGFAESSVRRYSIRNNSQMLDNLTTVAVPKSGTASLSGDVEIVSATRTGINSDGVAVYDVRSQAGKITLDADLENSTLTGRSDLLAVDGEIVKKRLTGSVTYDGMTVDLEGVIALQSARLLSEGIRALGHFSGDDSAAGKTFSGAFSVSE